LYRAFVRRLGRSGLTVAEGLFRAQMEVELVNDGPVTFLIDSRKVF
ncbi:MAG: D-aminoacyl-tRNA deacylase, partial [Thermodesulfobacteriota bacterium]